MGDSLLSYYLGKIEEKIEKLIERHKTYSGTDYLIAFRGEKKDYGKTSLMPSLFRSKEYVGKERYLFELLSDYGFLGNGVDRNIDKAIEAQHYIAISRMLDITFSLLPAIYFACESAAKELKQEDAYIYIFCFPEHYSPHSQYIEQFYTGILDESAEDITYSSNFKVISHSYSNERIKAQVGGFIFFPGREYKPIPAIYYDKIRIKGADKKNLEKELDRIFHINEASLFPEKEKLIPIIKERFKEGRYHKREITVEGEVESFLERIDYEIKMTIDDPGDCNDTQLLRVLRKEESDLLYFIENNCKRGNIDNDCRKKLIERTKEEFHFLRLKYGGRLK